MYRIRHIIVLAALMVLSAVSCIRDNISREDTQLMVSLYIPGSVMTRAETGTVNPLDDELRITSLQIWAFLSDDGTLISYKSFGTDLQRTGIPNSTITRFGLPLTEAMFNLLSSSSRPKVDVYVVANAASAVTDVPGEGTSRDALDQLVINKIGGNWPLTRAVPDAGLPMSGVLKGGDVTGGYPVLNISTIRLIRAVSKIRFVFCQQGIPASGETPADIANDACEIVGVSFDGTNDGKDCQISTTERLFTDRTFDLGDTPNYVPLSASISGSGGNPLISNSKLSIVEDPESLFFRGFGNETETADHYESRLDAAVSADSQVGPIYLRETDKTISGRILYRTTPDGDVQTARFSMDSNDVFSRNHTWIVYACFVEETMKLQLKVQVMPWEWESHSFDFTEGTVNVIRRFTVFETPTRSFYKTETDDGFYDIYFWHTVAGIEGENIVRGEIIISTPVGATLFIEPVPADGSQLPNAFIVSPLSEVIYSNGQNNLENGRIEDCQITVEVKANTAVYTDQQLEGQSIDLHFCVETREGIYVDLGSESIDSYRFRLDPLWYTYFTNE
ncbi:MAG: hypothetical protein IKZ51_07575 [Bacteroidales bacterium]|nr:hypothetical protein [Bacteroidales bacterium]